MESLHSLWERQPCAGVNNCNCLRQLERGDRYMTGKLQPHPVTDQSFSRLAYIARQVCRWRTGNAGGSPEITDQDDVAALAASSQRQLRAVTRPVKVENQSRFKIRNLFRRSASQFLSPDVR